MTAPDTTRHPRDGGIGMGSTVLVAGGTGTLGTQVVRRLVAYGLPVRVLTRDPARAAHLAGVDVVTGDVRDARAVGRAVDGVRTIVSAVQGFAGPGAAGPAAVDGEGNALLIRAAGNASFASAKHVVLVSVVGASPTHPMDLYRMKHRAESELRDVGGPPWTIVRATAFMETWAKIVGEPLVRTGRTLVFGRGRNPINFVSAHDVARFVELAVVDPAMHGVAVDVGGPENLTFEEVAATFARVSGRREAVVRHVPLPLMRVASRLLSPVAPAVARQIHAGVVMDTTDMTFDASNRARRYPAIPMTTLEEVVRRDFGGDGKR